MVIYGYTYAGGLLVGAAAITYLAGWPYAIPFFILAAFCLNFFRDPERTPPPGPVAVSPADGKVVLIVPRTTGGSRVCIFMNVFDVHVNRTPIPGKITEVAYKKGKFLNAVVDQASSDNEQNAITVEGQVGGRRTVIRFTQIAGLIARRILCYKRPGDAVGAAERVGLIKFGSRVDVELGPEWDVLVKTGEKVRAGSSAIARLRDSKGTV